MVLACSFCGAHENEALQVANVTYLDGSEAHFCLGCFVSGTVDNGAILLSGPAKVGKTSFCKAFADGAGIGKARSLLAIERDRRRSA